MAGLAWDFYKRASIESFFPLICKFQSSRKNLNEKIGIFRFSTAFFGFCVKKLAIQKKFEIFFL